MSNLTKNDKTSAEITALKNRINELEALVKYYEEQFRLSKHKRFGSSSEKSEYDVDQMNLFDEAEIVADENVPEPELVEIEKHCRRRKRSAGDRLPPNLPVEIVRHELGADERLCSECGGGLHVMGHEIRRELKIVPAQVRIVEHVQDICSCRDCEKNNDHTPIVKAAMPEPVIKGSFASPESVAHIMTQKFVTGVPLYRQEQEWNRQGIMLSRQTMSNWLIRCARDWLEPLYERLKKRLLERDVLHADETTVQVLHEPGKSAQSKSYMWLYRTGGGTDRHIVLYEYQPDRKWERPETFLKGFKGYLHADGYDGYHNLPDDFIVVGCWAHMRRKFDEALKVLPEKDREGSGAIVGKHYCDLLFKNEREFADMKPTERYQKRIELSKPVLDEFFKWAQSIKTLPKSLLGLAVHYAGSQRVYLERFLLDGRLEISNNKAERAVKPFVIGRKNWLFNNTPNGAKASSIIYSIIETAKENLLRPFEYLVFLFDNIPNATTGKLDDFLPWSDKIPGSCRSYPVI
ncbi:MAG: IS66 family transposase [Oscillospiraceae bacterium]|jgi:transposase|nr:IS66 family transposase [Oscillospiraceae bacterium]